MQVMVLASGDLWAGAEVMVYQLVRGLAEIPEVDLCVVLLNRERLAEELEEFGIEVHVVDESKLSFMAIVRVVRQLVTQFSPDIIHSHRYKENLLAWFAACGRKDIRLIATQHGMPEIVREGASIINCIRARFFFWLLSFSFDCTVLVSGEMRQLLVDSYGFSPNDLAVIHNGIYISKERKYRPGKRVVVGSAGRLSPVKDFLLLVNIAHLVISQCDEVDFVLAGDGPQSAVLEERIRAYGLQERFRLLGHQDDMDAFYQSLDVYINTSVHEGIPMSVLEAMSYSLPVLAADVGGFPEIVQNGEQGFLIGGRKKDDYVDRILQLTLDQNLRLEMAQAARDRVVACFSRAAMAHKYYNIYLKKMDGK